ncbi:KGK family protein [Stanieria cyanosphaera PCC 7437]|uniref:KGK family protein n=1 Tax=Stanieria cyanosphaera (strain ATCC 29371 / PCC 7437) TaxID=111780 RepID=K9XMM8_STAC7|nr:KGK domain-containing protein [Stanieria cyanosphaera]AFZ33748.1 KGK family protein [Stanieria cyanosphaera PCC 7437]
MEEQKQVIDQDEVLSVNRDDNILIAHHTYKVEEFLQELGKRIDKNKMEKWCVDGVPCQLLTPNQGWKKGKVKIVLQFSPDETESPLDPIRKEME